MPAQLTFLEHAAHLQGIPNSFLPPKQLLSLGVLNEALVREDHSPLPDSIMWRLGQWLSAYVICLPAPASRHDHAAHSEPIADSDERLQGVFHWIGSGGIGSVGEPHAIQTGKLLLAQQPYVNPHSTGHIQVASSSVFQGSVGAVVSRSLDVFSTKNERNAFVQVGFRDIAVRPFAYSFGHIKGSLGFQKPRNWRLEGLVAELGKKACNCQRWVTLDEHFDSGAFGDHKVPFGDNVLVFPIKTPVDASPRGLLFGQAYATIPFVVAVRITQTARNSTGSHYFVLGRFELFGEVAVLC
eukprot:TRINITY_DN15815_c0_g1_i1.p1 TRINITY_DN15815_c0_g1~~TRINITY_DN15815_c0_g1_i1.p1  ORF type:complete len:297 (-),score=32.35 TRINITY_DN15815_c0_g1_i1:238-1128(-)